MTENTVFKIGPISDLLDLDITVLEKLFKHLFNPREHYKQLSSYMQNMLTNEVLLRHDFTRNYTHHYQDEPQSDHWHNK